MGKLLSGNDKTQVVKVEMERMGHFHWKGEGDVEKWRRKDK